MHPIKNVATLSQAGLAVGAETRVRSRALMLWHLLSLDAPTVAAVWTWFVARTAGVALPWESAAAMFVAVWVLYAADRLLDARGLVGLEERHLFHRRYGRWFRWGIALACMALALMLPQLSPAAVRLYVVLGVLLVAWFVVIHSIDTYARPLPKEFVVGMFFAAAVFVPVVARRPELQRELLLPALAFGALCCLNCLFIFAWEHQGWREAPGHRLTLLAARWAPWFGVALAAACLLQRGQAIAQAVGLSAGSLVVLHWLRGRLERTTLRALADLMLLSPLVLWCWR